MSDLSITNTDSDYYYFTLRPLPSITTDHRPVPPTPPHRMRRSLDHSKTPPPSSTLTHKRTHRRSISLGPLPHTHPLSFVSGRSSVSSGGGGSHYEASESGSSVFSRRPSDDHSLPLSPSLVSPSPLSLKLLSPKLLFWLVLRVLPNKVEIYLHHRYSAQCCCSTVWYHCCRRSQQLTKSQGDQLDHYSQSVITLVESACHRTNQVLQCSMSVTMVTVPVAPPTA